MNRTILKVAVSGLAIIAAATVVILTPAHVRNCADTLTEEDLSWVEFCKARGYDIHDDRREVVEEFLDTWRGSVEEEQAFNNLPALPA